MKNLHWVDGGPWNVGHWMAVTFIEPMEQFYLDETMNILHNWGSVIDVNFTIKSVNK